MPAAPNNCVERTRTSRAANFLRLTLAGDSERWTADRSTWLKQLQALIRKLFWQEILLQGTDV
ncbi:unnamed protein product [marine sediment metagenome]|uniref:Uncharacterized protein n=1 Tax=marine sediment metagenome TaxID=412755 RepID=X0W4U5_9ZZZZ